MAEVLLPETFKRNSLIFTGYLQLNIKVSVLKCDVLL